MDIIDRDNPWFTSNVEFDSINTNIILLVVDKCFSNEIGELTKSTHRSHDIAGTSTTLLDICVVDTLIGIKQVDVGPVVFPSPPEVITT